MLLLLAIFTLSLLLAKPTAHSLPVYIGVGGGGYPVVVARDVRRTRVRSLRILPRSLLDEGGESNDGTIKGGSVINVA